MIIYTNFFIRKSKELLSNYLIFLNYEYLYGRNLTIPKALSTIIGTFQQKNRTISNFLRIYT